MSFGAVLQRLRFGVENIVTKAIVLAVLGLALLTPTAVLTVEHTAQPEFCNSCHIMEPYYESWLNSSHADVSCIECHYEPGSVETVEGKFKALSQLAKYVTRTAGTKPWAEVSDHSCMRSGCHSVRLLEGEIDFDGIKFDHRHHLLESRRGRRLQCVSCHSQIVQGDHLNVTSTVCFDCHFNPGGDPEAFARTSDCLMCHGPPEDVVEVAGRPFDHAEYLQRGVDCRTCHDPVIEGDGRVRRERCHSCHGEVGHIERFEETEFLHEAHVTNHKVECFECHDDIQHGLLPLRGPEPADSEGCGACHSTPHDTTRMMYAGTGAIGVEDRPSRMYETRVVCNACHTGRSGVRTAGLDPHADVKKAHAGLRSQVAAAGSVDCIHCHGPSIDGMLEDWQGAVAGQLERLEPLLDELEAKLPEDEADPAHELFDEAEHNLLMVQLDGSRGVHNPLYALDALRASAERIEAVHALVDPETELSATEGMPFVSEHGCTECHLGIETRATAGSFPHGRHLAATGMDCDSCHSTTEHGRSIFTSNDCSSCHHAENEEWDVYECSTCHRAQNDFLMGTLPDFDEHPSVMADMECTECHGDPPDLLLPKPAMCVLCHEEGYDRMMEEWQGTVSELTDELDSLRGRLADPAAGAEDDTRATFAAAERELELVTADGSRGIHNVHLTVEVLSSAADKLKEVARELRVKGTDLPAFPLQTEEGCSTCHVGFERSPTVMDDGREFPHRHHVQSGLACATCHSLEDHGQPAPGRADCASCHHEPAADGESLDCAGCHARQASVLTGELPGFASVEGPKSHVDCVDCHGEPPDLKTQPAERLCRVCHGKGVADLTADWHTTLDDLRERLATAIAGAANPDAPPVVRARRALELVDGDRSRGVHNSLFVRAVLERALGDLE